MERFPSFILSTRSLVMNPHRLVMGIDSFIETLCCFFFIFLSGHQYGFRIISSFLCFGKLRFGCCLVFLPSLQVGRCFLDSWCVCCGCIIGRLCSCNYLLLGF